MSQTLDISDEQADALLANPDFRADLTKVLKDNGHDLEALEVAQQREAARQFMQALRDHHEAKEKLAAIPAEMVDHVLSDGDARAALSADLVKAGIETPLDAMTPDQQQHMARQFILNLQERQQQAASGVPDAIIDQFLADKDLRGALEKALTSAGITEPIEAMPRETLGAIIAQMLQAAQGGGGESGTGGAGG